MSIDGSPPEHEYSFLSPEVHKNELFSAAAGEIFKSSTATSTSESMLQSLNKMIRSLEDEQEKQKFSCEMEDYYVLFTRYLADKSKSKPLDWNRIHSPNPEQIRAYTTLDPCPKHQESEILSKLAVLKLNGGLGTTMGCIGPKSAIEVREGLSFLDLTVHQIEAKNAAYGTQIPLVLMNSFNTDEETKAIIRKYKSSSTKILTFNQSRFPRISKESLMPLPRKHDAAKSLWYPPGHGDLYAALNNSGVLDQLLDDGKEYLFVSNVDNLGATVDTVILKHFIESQAEFIMEVTDKTRADVKGGTIIDYEGQVRLLEIAQVAAERVEDFKSIKKFKIFNTNNLWVNLRAIKRVLTNRELALEIIVNVKTEERTGEKVIQLETAAGAAIKHFHNAHGINVPRSRFLPVKSCSDLFAVQSDLYKLENGELKRDAHDPIATAPIVKLSDHFKKVQSFLDRFKTIPHILELDHLSVSGDVYFGSNVTLKGTVIIVANPPSRIDIPSGSILEDKVITGDLRIMDH